MWSVLNSLSSPSIYTHKSPYECVSLEFAGGSHSLQPMGAFKSLKGAEGRHMPSEAFIARETMSLSLTGRWRGMFYREEVCEKVETPFEVSSDAEKPVKVYAPFLLTVCLRPLVTMQIIFKLFADYIKII